MPKSALVVKAASRSVSLAPSLLKKPDRLLRSPDPGDFAGSGGISFNCHLVQGTPIGNLAIVYRPAPFLVHRIFLPNALSEQCEKIFPGICRNSLPCPESIQIARCIFDYLRGDTESPGPAPWHRLHLEHLSPLQVQVLRAVSHIPYGNTASYKTIAEAIGRPRAFRFVGTTLARNPFPILIPCHRVIRSDGASGQFGGGEELKQWLIDMES